MSEAADKAVAHILRQIIRNPRMAYWFDPMSESMQLLTAARAEELGREVEDFRAELYPHLQFERPSCGQCTCDTCKPQGN